MLSINSDSASTTYPSGPMRADRSIIDIDYTKDDLITEHGKEAFRQRYMVEGETSPQDNKARVAAYLATDEAQAQRLYGYMANNWFMPATPFMSNTGTTRGRVISCNVGEIQDSKASIINKLKECFTLATGGAGLGMYFGNIRSINEMTKAGETGGIFPFLKMYESVTKGANQGGLRRANMAVYLPDWHPEIEEFVKMRLAQSTNDPRRRLPDLHHAVCLSDAFMRAVKYNKPWDLKSPKTGEVRKTISARALWISILEARMVKGEPYIMFSDTVRSMRPEVYKKNDLDVVTSQLCAEIVLKTGIDYNGKDRTAVCALSQLNLETWDEWKDDPNFINDVMEFLDNGLEEYISTCDGEYAPAAYAAKQERSVGLGVMGFHSLLQKKGIPFESAMAKALNKNIFKKIAEKAKIADKRLADLRGPCPDAERVGLHIRFSHKTAIAPTASVSTLAGECSPGIEPWNTNVFGQKTINGNIVRKNKYLFELLQRKGMDTDEIWADISLNSGSIQHLEGLSQEEKDVFKTAEEIDQRWIIEMTADRQPNIDQAQSVNLFLHPRVHKKYLHKIHMEAWEKKVKTLYYCRSDSVAKPDIEGKSVNKASTKDDYVYEECLACQ